MQRRLTKRASLFDKVVLIHDPPGNIRLGAIDLLPVRVMPLPGEDNYSWLEATARAIGLSAKQTLSVKVGRRVLQRRPLAMASGLV
jgi:hypothetical protein